MGLRVEDWWLRVRVKERRSIPMERVDAAFGWKEAEHSREMHLHYDESTLMRRWEEAQMTWDM